MDLKAPLLSSSGVSRGGDSSSLAELMKKSSTRFAEVLTMLGKNYLTCVVTDGFQPVITRAISDSLAEIKKPEEKKDTDTVASPLAAAAAASSPSVPDLFAIQLLNTEKIDTYFSYSFLAYTVACIRVGVNPKGTFFALGKKYKIKYKTLEGLYRHMKNEIPQLPALPPDCLFGYYCCCLTRNSDPHQTRVQMTVWLDNLSSQYGASNRSLLSSYWYLGDDYQTQQRSQQTFHKAYLKTKAEVTTRSGNTTWIIDVDPFDESDAVSNLLQNVARNEFLEDTHNKIPNLPVGRHILITNQDATLLTLVDKAVSAGWPQCEKAVKNARDAINNAVNAGANEMVVQMKPIAKQIVDKINSKLKKKENKDDDKDTKDKDKDKDKEDDKKPPPRIGEVVEKWQFDKTQLGSRFSTDLTSNDPSAAVQALDRNVSESLEATIREKLASGAKALLGDSVADSDFIQHVAHDATEQAILFIKKITNVGSFIKSSTPFLNKRDVFERVVIGARSAGVDAMTAAVDNASIEQWKTMSAVALQLFQDIDSLKESVKKDVQWYHSLSEAATAPLLNAVDSLFEFQLSTLNTLRVTFTHTIKTKLQSGELLMSDEQTLKDVCRNTFRDVTFQAIQTLVHKTWVLVVNALLASAIQQCVEKFESTVWNDLKGAIEELESAIPDQISKMGLKIVPLTQKAASIIIGKSVDFILTKFFIKLENILFKM